jgi:Spy/CpxP family protein refolding chaperone
MQPPHGDPIADNFFSPELLMQNQKKLGLTDEQQKYIREQIREVQGKVTDLQWQIQGEQETLQTLAKQETADEKAFVASLDKMLSLENDIKRAHLTLLVRIKNKLTPEQQTQLRAMRRPQQPRGPMPGGPGGQGGPGGPGGPGGSGGQPQPR